MKDPDFSKYQFSRRKKPNKVCTINEIKNLTKDCCDEEVACKTTIKYVKQISD